KRDIPASDKTTSLGSYPLYGRLMQSQMPDGKAKVTALWRLYDARGREVGERKAEFEAKTSEWETAGEKMAERLAGLSAEALAPLLEDETSSKPASAPDTAPPSAAAALPDNRRLQVAVGKISGAPGDGGKALAAAVAAVLKRQELTIIGDAGKADLV